MLKHKKISVMTTKVTIGDKVLDVPKSRICKIFGNQYSFDIGSVIYTQTSNSIPNDAFEHYCLYPGIDNNNDGNNNNSNDYNIGSQMSDELLMSCFKLHNVIKDYDYLVYLVECCMYTSFGNDESKYHMFIDKLVNDGYTHDTVICICICLPLQFVPHDIITTDGFVELWLSNNKQFHAKIHDIEYTIAIWDDKHITYMTCLRNGVPHGLCQSWYYDCSIDDNNNKDSSKLQSRHWYVDGEVNGQFTCWYPTGNKEVEGYVAHCKVHGMGTSWYPTGIKRLSTPHVNGQKHGLAIMYHENGVMKHIGHFHHDIPTGDWFYYDNTGTLEYKQHFDNQGQVVDCVSYK